MQNKYLRHHSHHQYMSYDVKSILPTVATWSSSKNNLLRTHKNANTEVQFRNENEFIEKVGDYKNWSNVPIKASTKLPHNKPDILIWNKKTKTCSEIEISCPADVNKTRKTNEKSQKYAPLLRKIYKWCKTITNSKWYPLLLVLLALFRTISKNLLEN